MPTLPFLLLVCMLTGCAAPIVYYEKPTDHPTASVILSSGVDAEIYAGGFSGARLSDNNSPDSRMVYYLPAGHYEFRGACTREFMLKDGKSGNLAEQHVVFYLSVKTEKNYVVDCDPDRDGLNFFVTDEETGQKSKLKWHSF